MTANDHHRRYARFAIAAIFAFAAAPQAWAQKAQATGASSAERGIILRLPVDPMVEPDPPESETAPLPLDTSQRASNPVVIQLPPAETTPHEQPSDIAPSAEAPDPASRPSGPSFAQEGQPAERFGRAGTSGPAGAATSDAERSAPPSSERAAQALSPDAPAAASHDSAPGAQWLGFIALALAGLIPIALALVAFVWVRRRTRSARSKS